jgi:uncharacterized protein with HEPN domain
MEKDDLVYAGHMLDMARKALNLAEGKSRDDFDRNEALALALAHLLQVIGEAARRVSDEFRELHPDIPWRAIVGMRHRIVHDYMAVDFDIVWDVVTRDLPQLVASLAKLFPEASS